MNAQIRVARGRASAMAAKSRSCRPLGQWNAIAIGALALLSTAPFSSAHADAATDAQRLLNQHKCHICHSDNQAKAGPAYADVAALYRTDRDAVSVIAVEIRRGIRGGGPWHMPPHPEVSYAEARTMARYILSLDPADTSRLRDANDSQQPQ